MGVLVTGHRSSDAILTALSSSTTQFTGVVHLSTTDKGLVTKQFERLHHTRRPNGKRLPIQCPDCQALRCWKVPGGAPKKYNEELVFRCNTKGCPGVCVVPPLEGFEPLTGDASKVYCKTL